MAEPVAYDRRSHVALAWRDRIVVVSCAAAVTALAWAYLVYVAAQMPRDDATVAQMAMPMPMPSAWSLAELAFLFAMWSVMMVGMMAPAAAPVLLLFAAAQARRGEARMPITVALFALGYAIVWIAFSACAALAQWTLHAFAMLSPAMSATSATVGGAIVCAAGAYQLLPAKRACLTRCRSPIAFLMTHWRDGPAGALSMGLRHGAWCLGCCFALMTMLFAVGVMNLVFIAALALFVLLEKTGPAGVVVARLGGVLLIAAGVAMIATA